MPRSYLFRSHEVTDASAIEALFLSVFTKSENVAEGALVGTLARDLIANTKTEDIFGFVAVDGEEIVGAIFFSRLTVEKPIDIFILSPVAVRSDCQGQGVGQELITYGLREMKTRGVKFVATYGDPAFYVKIGFTPLSEKILKAPLKLSRPEGWLGQTLTGDSLEAIPGTCSCVSALDNPAYW